MVFFYRNESGVISFNYSFLELCKIVMLSRDFSQEGASPPLEHPKSYY